MSNIINHRASKALADSGLSWADGAGSRTRVTRLPPMLRHRSGTMYLEAVCLLTLLANEEK